MTVIQAATIRVSTLADGTLRLVVDIEPGDAQDAFKLFGSPGTAVALAALKPANTGAGAQTPELNTQAQPLREKPQRMGPLCEWAVKVCKEPKFWEWLGQRWGGGGNEKDAAKWHEKDAANWLRGVCRVETRSELDTNPTAAEELHERIRRPYAAWLQTQGVTA